MTEEDAYMINTTLLALEDRFLIRKSRLPFEQWRDIRNLLLTIRAVFANTEIAAGPIAHKFKAMIVAATRYNRDEILVNCAPRISAIVNWMQNRLPPVS